MCSREPLLQHVRSKDYTLLVSTGGHIQEDALFCSRCDSRIAEPEATLQVNPFRRIRVRSLLLWGLISVPVLVLVYVIAFAFTSGGKIDPLIDVLIVNLWLYGLLTSWIIWKSTRNRVDFGALIGTYTGRLSLGLNCVLGSGANCFLNICVLASALLAHRKLSCRS